MQVCYTHYMCMLYPNHVYIMYLVCGYIYKERSKLHTAHHNTMSHEIHDMYEAQARYVEGSMRA